MVTEENNKRFYFQWVSPVPLLKEFNQKKIDLAGPQIYEPARMAHFQKLKELCMFSQRRQWQGLGRILPVVIVLADGPIVVYEGKNKLRYCSLYYIIKIR